MSARPFTRVNDLAITLAVGCLVLVAWQADALRETLARGEARLLGRARLFESSIARGAARTGQRFLRGLEAQAYDRGLELRAALHPVPLDNRLVIVGIDDSSLARFGRWPWGRDRQAQLVEGLARAGARGIVLDIEYPETSGELDDVLATAFARAPTHGMMYTRELPRPGDQVRHEQEARILDWLLRTRPGAAAPLPAELAVLARSNDTSRRHADDVLRLGRFLMQRVTAGLIDALREGVLPELAPPPAPPGIEAVHPVMLLPAALGVVTENPDDSVDTMVTRLGTTIGYPPDKLAAAPPVQRHLLALVTLLAAQRSRLSELNLLIARLRDQILDREVSTALERDPSATPAQAAAATALQLKVPASVLEVRLTRLLDRRRSLATLRERDLLQVSGYPLPDLPLRGEIIPPIPVVTRAYRGAGLSVVDRDLDGVLRRVPLVYRVDQSFPGGKSGAGDPPGLLTVGLQTTLAPAASLLGLDLKRMVFTDDHLVIPGERGGRAIPVDAHGAALIDFRGAWDRDGFSRINAVQVLEVRAMRDAQDAYLRLLPEYQVIDALQGAFSRPSPLTARPAFTAFQKWWEGGAARFTAEREQLVRDQLAKVGLDMKSMVQALEDARQSKDQATEEEVLADIEKLRPTYDQLLVKLPVLDEKLRRAVAGRVCMIGVTSTGTTDISVVPVQARYINLGVHVSLLNQILAGSNLRQADFWRTDLPILVCYLIMLPLILPALSIRGGLFATLLLLFAHFSLATWALVYHGLWLAVASPVIAVSAGYLLSTLRRYLQDERAKLKIRAMFETYLDPKVVELMVDDERLWRELGGTVRTITPYFSDLANFATASELLSPDELSDLLSEYLTPMTDIILKHGGIRERYVGDAIVAFFGAPVEFPDHATQACLTCIEQHEAIVALRARWWADEVPWYRKIRAAGLDLQFRIGVSTGPAKVGNFGSRTVKNYSMNGDVVNLASRLESANKFYGTEMLCTEQTFLDAEKAVEAREIDLIQVVGKQLPVKIYEVLGRKGSLVAPRDRLPARFSAALVIYRARRFDEARRAFQALLVDYPDDGPTLAYLARLDDAAYLATLGPDWNGTWVALSK